MKKISQAIEKIPLGFATENIEKGDLITINLITGDISKVARKGNPLKVKK